MPRLVWGKSVQTAGRIGGKTVSLSTVRISEDQQLFISRGGFSQFRVGFMSVVSTLKFYLCRPLGRGFYTKSTGPIRTTTVLNKRSLL